MSDEVELRSTQLEGTPFSWEPTPTPQPTSALQPTPTPTPAPVSTRTPTPVHLPRVSRSKVNLTDEDRLILVRLCVEHQSKHRRGNKENFWKDIKEYFIHATGKRLSDPRDTMSSLLIQLEVDDRQEAKESGTVQNDSDLKQVLRLWKDHMDAMTKDTEDKKKVKEELQAEQEAASQRRNNLLLTRSQKRKTTSPVNLDSSDDEESPSSMDSRKRAKRHRRKSSTELNLLVKTITDMRKDSQTFIEKFGDKISNSLQALATNSAPERHPQADPKAYESRLTTLENEVRSQTSAMGQILAMLNDLKQSIPNQSSHHTHIPDSAAPNSAAPNSTTSGSATSGSAASVSATSDSAAPVSATSDSAAPVSATSDSMAQ
ncbi:hypothetical protein BDZ91DRAFT_749684 [Kalaharituber pfeilii]|nr:hypothetical protein BDZ91DRAFT_749684 [Kalaharituber pfeilii]